METQTRVFIPLKPKTRAKLIKRISKEQKNGERISYDTFINVLLEATK